MLDQDTYRLWTKAFGEGSDYRGDWNEGSEIVFIAPHEEGEMGMAAHIKESRPHDFVSIEFDGLVENGVRDTESEKAKAWVGAHENYTFNEKDGGTEVVVDVDVEDSYKEMMDELWPKALAELKSLAESA